MAACTLQLVVGGFAQSLGWKPLPHLGNRRQRLSVLSRKPAGRCGTGVTVRPGDRPRPRARPRNRKPGITGRVRVRARGRGRTRGGLPRRPLPLEMETTETGTATVMVAASTLEPSIQEPLADVSASGFFVIPHPGPHTATGNVRKAEGRNLSDERCAPFSDCQIRPHFRFCFQWRLREKSSAVAATE